MSISNNKAARALPHGVGAVHREDLPHQAFDHGAPPDTGGALRHELAGLLDGSMRHLQLAIRRLSEHEDEDASLDNLQATQEALEQMTQLLHRWRSDHPIPAPTPGTTTLGQTVLRAVRLVEPEAQQHNVCLSTEFDTGAATLPAGPLRHALDNALRNSLEAIANDKHPLDPPPCITVAAQRSVDQLQLTVTDTGPGLSPQVINSKGAFRFGISTKPQGSGTGVTLIRRIADALDGELTLQPNTPRGVVLTLRCPVRALERPLDIPET